MTECWCLFVCRSVVSAEFGAGLLCSVSRILQTAALPVEPRPDTGNTPAAGSALRLDVLLLQEAELYFLTRTNHQIGV